MKSENSYKPRSVCPKCLSLSYKKSYGIFKCDNCKEDFDKPLTLLLMHKNTRCIDNDVSSRKDRLVDNKVMYQE